MYFSRRLIESEAKEVAAFRVAMLDGENAQGLICHFLQTSFKSTAPFPWLRGGAERRYSERLGRSLGKSARRMAVVKGLAWTYLHQRAVLFQACPDPHLWSARGRSLGGFPINVDPD